MQYRRLSMLACLHMRCMLDTRRCHSPLHALAAISWQPSLALPSTDLSCQWCRMHL